MTTLSELLAAQGVLVPETGASTRDAVRRGAEFERIRSLPRRALDELDAAWIQAAFARPGGELQLRLIQAAALAEIHAQRGLFAPIGVGQGKTLIGLLAGAVVGAARSVYLTQPGLLAQIERDLEYYSQHFRIDPASIHLVSYGALSSKRGVDLLEGIAPDLIFADEVQALRHFESARTMRFLRYMAAHPETVFCAASGTITSRSIKDYAHLAALALKERSPLPRTPGVLSDWARALDAELPRNETRLDPGALLDFCAPGEYVRDGFRRRVVETPGVVATTESALGTGLELYSLRASRHLEKLALLVDASQAETEWDGMPLDNLTRGKLERELAQGFYYKWEWPDGEPDLEWLDARGRWLRLAKRHLDSQGADTNIDTLGRLADAVRNATIETRLKDALSDWDTIREARHPRTVPVWRTNVLLDVAERWLGQASKPGESIIWYEHDAVGRELGRVLKALWVEPGDDPALHEGRDLMLSIRAHGTGRNLQAWSRNLVLCPPSSGAVWEQLIARTHRPGQGADVVTFHVLQHVERYRRALARAKRDAAYIQSTTGQEQKLTIATWAGDWP